MRKISYRILALLILASLFLFSCGEYKSSEAKYDESSAVSKQNESGEAVITTNNELYDYFINCWQTGAVPALYSYLGSEITGIINSEDFTYSLDYYTRIEGAITGAELTGSVNKNGTDIYTATVSFGHANVVLTLSIKDLKIVGYFMNIRFKDTYERDAGNNVTERYFPLENDGLSLNAVYTYINDGAKHPTALIIGGSGPSDFNESIAMLTPTGDLASALAEKGVNTLRLDKRTLNYGASFKATDGLEQEYFSDCRAALDYLRAQDSAGEIYLIGHSLGMQIAAALAAEQNDIAGIVALNGSARHLAAIAADQYIASDPSNRDKYESARDAAMTATDKNAKGLYYFNATDYYWASYNKLDTIASIKAADEPVLVINSTADLQSFDADIKLWQSELDGYSPAKIYIDDKISHFGYEIDASDPTVFYRRAQFPTRISDMIADFITSGNK
jgi:Predicted hydrolase of the alpha/beta superfamily